MYSSKTEFVYKDLKQKIYKGGFKQGEKIVLNRLAKEFNCSEIPVREAMNQLSSESLVKLVPHTGYVVTTLTPQEVNDILEIRIVLEALATKLAIDYLDNNDISRLEEILKESEVAYRENNYDEYKKLNKQFHMYIYNKSGNSLLVKNIRDLWNNASRYKSVFNENRKYIENSINEHQDILDAIKRKNKNDSHRLMIVHKQRAKDNIVKLIDEI